ncbi:hypothetical protein [Lentibacillus daqui]|uniref:hypothetical protein n=1 Tax=Lentibacillus daqui TaxID=2911514 RepID=UPI0022B1BEF9|nr:hypothetical protein [Lentibacillus daqui]
MEIFALTGPSGTGKSTSALSYAYEKDIPAIIDDGLLIFHGKRVSGTSAKFEKNMITAVKRATFYFGDHAEEIKRAIQFYKIDKILIIGTSTKMVNLIALKLQLGKIDHYIEVKDIRKPSEISLAKFTRNTKGDHLMPIPYLQVEQSFFKKIIKRGVKIFSPKREVVGETTIVRPNFHKDSLIISDKVFKNIVLNVCFSYAEVASCDKVLIELENSPVINVELKLYYLKTIDNMIGTIKKIQQGISRSFNTHLGLELDSIDVCITKLV